MQQLANRRQAMQARMSQKLQQRRSARPLCVRAAQQAVEAPPKAEVQKRKEHAVAIPNVSKAIMLQGFGWDSCEKGDWYQKLEAKIPDIKAAGFTHLWLPPPSRSVAPQGYMPGQLYNLRSAYGNKKQLKALNAALKAAGIKPIADIVINHRCADEQDENGVWNQYRDDEDHDNIRIDWGAWAITRTDPHFNGTGNPDTGEDYHAAPDLDHANPDLRAALKDWLNWLRDEVGFSSWRLDYAKGYASEFVKEYIEGSQAIEELNVGEVWVDLKWNGADLDPNQNDARQKLCDWIDSNQQSCMAFDFVTKGILNEAVKNTQYWRLRDDEGKAPGLLGWWPGMTVTFVANHDTDSTAQHWPFPADGFETGYAYILTHPGVPCVFWDHIIDGDQAVNGAVKALINIRQRNVIHADSKLEILTAEDDLYVARIDDKLAVKLGPRIDLGDLLPKKEEGWKLAASGKDWAVWEKQQQQQQEQEQQ